MIEQECRPLECPRCGGTNTSEHGRTHEAAIRGNCADCQLPFLIFEDIGEEPE
jgi:hypothetical protein